MSRLSVIVGVSLLVLALGLHPSGALGASGAGDGGLPASGGGQGRDAGSADNLRISFDNIHYDGQELSGRFLVGAISTPVTLDRRLIENVSLVIDSVSDCASGQPVEFLVMDVLPPPAAADDLLVLQADHWYGVDTRFPLFNEKLSGQPGPDCIDVAFSFHLPRSRAGRRGDARIEVRAARPLAPGGGSGASDGGRGDAGVAIPMLAAPAPQSTAAGCVERDGGLDSSGTVDGGSPGLHHKVPKKKSSTRRTAGQQRSPNRGTQGERKE